MLRKVLMGLAVWLSTLGLVPLAFGSGIPVVDALLNSTAVVQLKESRRSGGGGRAASSPAATERKEA